MNKIQKKFTNFKAACSQILLSSRSCKSFDPFMLLLRNRKIGYPLILLGILSQLLAVGIISEKYDLNPVTLTL